MWTNSKSDPIRYGCENYEGKAHSDEAVVAGRYTTIIYDPAEEILNHSVTTTHFRAIENPACPVGLRQDDRNPALCHDAFPEFVTVIASVTKDDSTFQITENFLDEEDVMADTRCERYPQRSASSVGAGVNKFGVCPLDLPQRPLGGLLRDIGTRPDELLNGWRRAP